MMSLIGSLIAGGLFFLFMVGIKHWIKWSDTHESVKNKTFNEILFLVMTVVCFFTFMNIERETRLAEFVDEYQLVKPEVKKDGS